MKVLNFIRVKLKILYFKLIYRKKIKIGKNLMFRKNFKILIENNGFLEIGDNCFFNNDCSINCLDEIKIGNHTIFGENVRIYDHNHLFGYNYLAENLYKTSKIKIGNNNWICSNVTLLSKTNIGNYNIIGAGVVLNETIDDNNLIRNDKIQIEKIIKKEN